MGGAHTSSLPPRRPEDGLVFESDRAAASESELCTPRTRGPHAKGLHRAIYSRRRPLDSLTRAPSRLHQRRRNPRFPPLPHPAVDAASSSRSTPRDAQGGEEPAGVACRRPRAPRRPRDIVGVRVPRHRVDRPLRRISVETAALDGFACSRVSQRCRPRFNPWPETLDWGPVGELRRPAPPQPLADCFAPPPLACKSTWPPDRDVTRQIYSSRPAARVCSAPLDQDPASLIQPASSLNPQATAAIRSRSNGSGSSQPRVNRSNPDGPSSFAENPPSFPVFTDIPFHLRSFLAV
jgi:hypothetical protein